MAVSARKLYAGTIAAALAFTAAPLHAQEASPLSQEEVTSFFDEMTQEVTAMVEAGDFDGMLELAERIIADEAHFYVSVDSYAGDDRKSFSVLSLSKEEVTELGRMALGVMTGAQGQQGTIDDYAISFEIREVTPAGPDAATVTAQFTESATISLAQGADAATDDAETETATDQPAAGEGSISLEATADCHMLIRRDDGEEQLMFGLSACSASIRH